MQQSSRSTPNPYFFFRSPGERDWILVARWMGETGRLSDIRELKILKQLKRQAAERRSLIAVVGGKPGFLLEWTVTGDTFLTGPPALHASPWWALEAWGESIRYLLEVEGLSKVSTPLIPLRAAEIRAMKRLGCRRVQRAVDSIEEVWVGLKERIFENYYTH